MWSLEVAIGSASGRLEQLAQAMLETLPIAHPAARTLLHEATRGLVDTLRHATFTLHGAVPRGRRRPHSSLLAAPGAPASG